MTFIRPDRLLTIGVVHPLIRAWRGLNQGAGDAAVSSALPILMYHSISEDHQPDVAPRYRTVTTAQRFAEQMQFLYSRHYQAVTLRDGLDWLKRSANGNNCVNTPSTSESRAAIATGNHQSSFNPPLVVLTFDDGFHDFYTAAFPVLHQFGFRATMFLPTAFIGNNGIHRQFLGRDCLTWTETRELSDAGFEFGSHTVNHPKMIDLSWSEIKSELSDSKSQIEQQLGLAVTSFAYPYAFPQSDAAFVTGLRGFLSTAGYETCVTTEIGFATSSDDPLQLKRLPVSGEDDLEFFAAKLDGAYNWLRWPQGTVKSVKALLGH